jgi:hypothetical protein
MLFLIDYDRRLGQIHSLEKFADEVRHLAEESRLELELSLSKKGIEREVVLLEAASEELLRRTHRRYFEDVGSLIGEAQASPSPTDDR